VSRIRATTFGHLSVLVTAFWRRGKPPSALKPSVRLGRQAFKDIAARQKPELQAIGSAWRCSPTDTRERSTATRGAEEEGNR
jgi:hypothetical protein